MLLISIFFNAKMFFFKIFIIFYIWLHYSSNGYKYEFDSQDIPIDYIEKEKVIQPTSKFKNKVSSIISALKVFRTHSRRPFVNKTDTLKPIDTNKFNEHSDIMSLTDNMVNYINDRTDTILSEINALRSIKNTAFTGGLKAIVTFKNGIIAGNTGYNIKLWNSNGSFIRELDNKHDNEINELIAMEYPLPDVLAAGTDSGNIDIYDDKGFAIRFKGQHNKKIRAMCTWSDYLVSGSDDGAIIFWDIKGAIFVRTLISHKGGIEALVIHRYHLLSCAYDGSIEIWNRDGELLGTLTDNIGHQTIISLSTYLASVSYDNSIKIWSYDLSVSNQAIIHQTLTDHTSRIISIVVLLNGFIASGSADGTIKIWDPDRGTLIRTLTGHRSSVISLTVLPNSHLVSVGEDNAIIIWHAY